MSESGVATTAPSSTPARPSSRATSTAAITPPSTIETGAAHRARTAVQSRPPTSTAAVSSRVPAISVVSNQSGTASMPAKKSEANTTTVSPNSHATRKTMTIAVAATISRRKSPGDLTRADAWSGSRVSAEDIDRIIAPPARPTT